MIRKAFLMSVYPSAEAEYEARHNPIWPELEATLNEHSVRSYSIFLHPTTRRLFAYVEVEEEARWDTISDTPVCKRWWAHMRELMPTNSNNSPVSEELREVFHMGR